MPVWRNTEPNYRQGHRYRMAAVAPDIEFAIFIGRALARASVLILELDLPLLAISVELSFRQKRRLILSR